MRCELGVPKQIYSFAAATDFAQLRGADTGHILASN